MSLIPCRYHDSDSVHATNTRFNSVQAMNRMSLLWRCWLGVGKSIRPVQIEWWCVGVVIWLERGADCLHLVQLMPLHPKTPSSLASFQSRLVLPFRYRLIQVVQEKRPLNGCSNRSIWNKMVTKKRRTDLEVNAALQFTNVSPADTSSLQHQHITN